ncbi:MAG TPA: DUF2171 domain-containing protein [Gaiellaceae bacterium]|nr:DUF2171 domain-containing protein [Gaiellaceae bacterium]
MLLAADRAALAETKAYFREVNERIRGQARLLEGDDHLYRFLCECADPACHVSVSATLAEYREIRARPGRCLLVPGHERAEIERIVERTERFAVSEPAEGYAARGAAVPPNPKGGRTPMADPVSWLLIRPGWKVVSAEGGEIGEVDQVVGDDTEDIFDGLAIATSALGRPRYVPAERVARITDGAVELSLSAADAASLEEYGEPPASLEIEADNRKGLGESLASGYREAVSAVAPVPGRRHSASLWDRVKLLVHRERGR